MSKHHEIVTLRIQGLLKPEGFLLPAGEPYQHGFYSLRNPFTLKLYWAYLAHPYCPQDRITASVLLDLDMWGVAPDMSLVLDTWTTWRRDIQEEKLKLWPPTT